jgi:hypothetical protein
MQWKHPEQLTQAWQWGAAGRVVSAGMRFSKCRSAGDGTDNDISLEPVAIELAHNQGYQKFSGPPTSGEVYSRHVLSGSPNTDVGACSCNFE